MATGKLLSLVRDPLGTLHLRAICSDSWSPGEWMKSRNVTDTRSRQHGTSTPRWPTKLMNWGSTTYRSSIIFAINPVVERWEIERFRSRTSYTLTATTSQSPDLET